MCPLCPSVKAFRRPWLSFKCVVSTDSSCLKLLCTSFSSILTRSFTSAMHFCFRASNARSIGTRYTLR
eukprot:jgi/Botrbrau1/21404/Bobra.0216s0023.1